MAEADKFCGECGAGLPRDAAFCAECGAVQGMACPACAELNEAGERFCSACGQALPVVCVACRTVNEPGAAFCAGCGQSLTEAIRPHAGDGRRSPAALRWIGTAAVLLIAVGVFWGAGEDEPSSGGGSGSGYSNAPTAATGAAASRSASTSSGAASAPACSRFLAVEFDTPGPDTHLQVSLSTPSGTYWEDNGGGSGYVNVSSGSACVGGTYRFNVSKGGTNWVNAGPDEGFSASGSFSVPDTASRCTVQINTFGLSPSCY